MTRDRNLIGSAVSCVILTLCGCSSNPSNPGRIPIQKTHPLSEIAATDQNFSSYKPSNAYQELGPNVMARTIFEAAGPAGYRIEVRDLRVDARKKAENISFQGAAFLQVIDGVGVITSGAGHYQLSGGATFSISQGQTATLEGTSDQPLIIRVRLVEAQ